MTYLRIVIPLHLFIEHDLFGKPVSTFPDHALSGDQPMSSSDPENNKKRNRKIAQNEAERQTTGAIRVSTWAIAVAVIAGIIVFAIVWAWMNR
jgi:hypothetical protein